MKKRMIRFLSVPALLLAVAACEFPQPNIEGRATPPNPHLDRVDRLNGREVIELRAHSATPSLIKKADDFEYINVMPLISSEDKLEESADFVYGGSADGMGLLKSGSGYTLLVNHEDNFSVSRIRLDKSFRPVSTGLTITPKRLPFFQDKKLNGRIPGGTY